MTTNSNDWVDTLIHLLALSARLEDEGQYNLAKLARAAADSLCRHAAYRQPAPTASQELATDVRVIAGELARLGFNTELLSALTQGADLMARSQLPLIGVAPHPYVCRTCGYVTLTAPDTTCPTCGAWPGTFQRFMPNYWFDALEPLAALERLRATPVEVASLIEGLSEAQLNRTPMDGGWAIRNVLTHLRDAQDVLAFRLDQFLQRENPALEAKAVWAWAAAEEERPPTALEIFGAYQSSRQETLCKLEQLPLAYWWRTGRHAEFGVVTLRQQVSYFAAHEETHLSQLGVLRASLTSSEPSIVPDLISVSATNAL